MRSRLENRNNQGNAFLLRVVRNNSKKVKGIYAGNVDFQEKYKFYN